MYLEICGISIVSKLVVNDFSVTDFAFGKCKIGLGLVEKYIQASRICVVWCSNQVYETLYARQCPWTILG